MKPVRTIELTHAAAIDGSSHGRTPAVLLVLDERNALIRAAARFYPGDSDREIARRLHRALAIYRSSRWQRRDCIEATCPAQHRGKLMQAMWLILKTRDYVPSEMTIRRALGYS
jgi:hypothetical protein